jgi:ABC-type transport system involved in multi-copper enzyme maturation permease subunit
MMARKRNLIIAALLACIPAAFTLELGSISVLSSNGFADAIQQHGVTLLFPGILGAMEISGSTHAFHLWVAAIWNFVFYFLICWAIAALIGRALRRINSSQRAGKS